jgi:hypothetical protein
MRTGHTTNTSIQYYHSATVLDILHKWLCVIWQVATKALEEKQWWDGIVPVFLFNLTGILGSTARAALFLRVILLSIVVLEDHKLQERKFSW